MKLRIVKTKSSASAVQVVDFPIIRTSQEKVAIVQQMASRMRIG
jgi:hypothetical protein